VNESIEPADIESGGLAIKSSILARSETEILEFRFCEGHVEFPTPPLHGLVLTPSDTISVNSVMAAIIVSSIFLRTVTEQYCWFYITLLGCCLHYN
jgi:hypothetical protein